LAQSENEGTILLRCLGFPLFDFLNTTSLKMSGLAVISEIEAEAALNELLLRLESEIELEEETSPRSKQYTEIIDRDGNLFLIPLLSCHTSPLRSPRRRFIVTERIKSPPPTPKPSSMPMKLTYNQRNYPARNKYCQFIEEGHKFVINKSSKGVKSVTEFIHTTLLPDTFNASNVSNGIIDKEEYKTGKSEYSGMDAQTIRDHWEAKNGAARTHGTKIHAAIEKYFLLEDQGLDTSQIDYLPAAFRQFRKDYPRLKPKLTETEVYDEHLLLGGKFDAVLTEEVDTSLTESTPRNPFLPKERAFLFDWKTNDKIMKPTDLIAPEDADKASRRYDKAKQHESVRHFANTPYTQGALQLNLYRHFLLVHYHIHIEKMFLWQPGSRDLNDPTYHLIPVPYIDVEPMLQAREREVAAFFNY
jgi:hypothetical protein